MWLQLAVVAWVLRDQSYLLVICSEEFNIPAACGGSSINSSSTVLVTAVLLF